MNNHSIESYFTKCNKLTLRNLPRPQSSIYRTPFFIVHPLRSLFWVCELNKILKSYLYKLNNFIVTNCYDLLKNIGTVKVKIYDQFKDEFRTSKAELLEKIVNGLKQLTIFPKSSTSDVQHGSECTFAVSIWKKVGNKLVWPTVNIENNNTSCDDYFRLIKANIKKQVTITF